MSSDAFILQGTIDVDINDAVNSLNRVDRQVDSSGNSMSGVFGKLGRVIVGAFAVDKIVEFGTKCLSAASEVEEMENKFNVVFKNTSKAMDEWADSYADSIGRSKTEIKTAISNQSDLMIGMGMTEEVAGDLSKKYTELAYDLASFNNVQDSTALEAMTKAMFGETEMAKQLGHKETVAPVVAISAYVSLCDSFTKVAVEGVTDLVEVVNVLPREFTNAQGLFLGMIVAIVSMEIYCRLADSGKLAIKMPESVPSNVSSAFNALFPAVLTILIISAFGLLFTKVTGNSIYNMISTWIQAPLRGILTGLPGYLLIFFLSTCFWVIGIHGTQVLKPVYQATMLEAVIANTDAAANGQTPQFILNETFISCFTTMGGAGCTIGLLFAMLLASKRSDHRTIAKLSLAPGLFNINETMTFGLPIVLNPIFMIPFILTPVITATFAYFMTVIGFCGKMIYAVPWTTPPLLIAWLGSGGSIGAVITQALCVVLSFIVYLPFVFAANKQEN